jgi:hypothetical protein
MRYGVRLSWLGLCLLPNVALGQVIVEAPQVNQVMAGIRPYFGIVCETAGQPPSTITLGFNGGTPTRIASGIDRADSKDVCNNDGLNGIVGFTNFNLLPQGANTFELYRDGLLVATVPFRNAPWSDETEFIPGSDPTIPTPAAGTFDPTAPATEAYLLLGGFPHPGRAVWAHYDPTVQGLGVVSTRAQTDPGITKFDLAALLGNNGIQITILTDPPETIFFPGKNGITNTDLGPTPTNFDGGIIGALAAVLGMPTFPAPPLPSPFCFLSLFTGRNPFP